MNKTSIVALLLVFWMAVTGHAVEIELPAQPDTAVETAQAEKGKIFFGQQLFEGNFKNVQQYRYNPDYLINVGDVINVKIWGAYEFVGDLTVDKQGNIFIPKIGVVSLLGVPNKRSRPGSKRRSAKSSKKMSMSTPTSSSTSRSRSSSRGRSRRSVSTAVSPPIRSFSLSTRRGGSCPDRGVFVISRSYGTNGSSSGSTSTSSS